MAKVVKAYLNGLECLGEQRIKFCSHKYAVTILSKKTHPYPPTFLLLCFPINILKNMLFKIDRLKLSFLTFFSTKTGRRKHFGIPLEIPIEEIMMAVISHLAIFNMTS